MTNQRSRWVTVEAPRSKHRHDEETSQLLQRIRSEFLEMPGLRLTAAQAARLWAVDRHMSERLLDNLTITGFLLKKSDGAYLHASAA